jgi:hypothetical protein
MSQHEIAGARFTMPSKEDQLKRATAKLEAITLEDLEASFQARRDYGPGYGYESAAEWWRAQQTAYGFDDSMKPAWVTDEVAATPGQDDDEVVAFVRAYAGTFEFLVSLKRQLTSRGYLSERQYASAAKCLVREQEYQARKAERATPAANNEPVATEGMYRLADGTIFKVQKAVHGSGRLYAKRLIPPSEFGGSAQFEYAPGMIYRLTLEDKMTLEQAKEFGALYGTCCVCGRTLTNEVSIAAGIGPICGGRMTEWS